LSDRHLGTDADIHAIVVGIILQRKYQGVRKIIDIHKFPQ